MVTAATFGEALKTSSVRLAPSTFKTGSRGFKGRGKITLEGKRYQVVSLVAVEIGSKPVGEAEDED